MQLEMGLAQTPGSETMWRKLGRALSARRGAFGLALVVLSSLAFRLYISRECSLWLDEVSTHLDALGSWPEVLRGPSREHPPLMYVLVKLVIGQFGQSETALRSVSLFFGSVLLLATYELCRQLKLSSGRTLVVVATLALCPFFIRHGTECRQYAMLPAFITLATTRALRGPRRVRDLLGFAVCAFGASLTHYFGLAYALALLATVALGITQLRRVGLLGWLWRIGLLGGLLTLLVGVAVRALALGRYYGTTHVGTAAATGIAVNTALLQEIIAEFSFLTSHSWPRFVEPLLAVAGLLLLTWRLRGVARLLPLGIGVAPCLAVLFVASGHFIAGRYLVPSAILYHLGACVALFEVIKRVSGALARVPRARAFAPLIGPLTLIAALAVRLREFPVGFGAGYDDYRGLQSYFENTLAKDTRVIAYYGYFGQLIFNEYGVGLPVIWLENFRRVRGIDRYLLVEIHVDGEERQAEFEAIVAKKLGLTPEAWHAIPRTPIPHSVFQSAVPARLVQFEKNYVFPAVPPPKRHHKPRG